MVQVYSSTRLQDDLRRPSRFLRPECEACSQARRYRRPILGRCDRTIKAAKAIFNCLGECSQNSTCRHCQIVHRRTGTSVASQVQHLLHVCLLASDPDFFYQTQRDHRRSAGSPAEAGTEVACRSCGYGCASFPAAVTVGIASPYKAPPPPQTDHRRLKSRLQET